MYSKLGDRIVKDGELVGTFTKDEMVTFLLDELNELYTNWKLNESTADELEDALSQIDDLEMEIFELEEKLEEYEK